jgi:hypothetical protein
LIILLIIITTSCTTVTKAIVPSKYVLPPVPEVEIVKEHPQVDIDKETLKKFQDVLISWKKQKNFTQEQKAIIDAFTAYNNLIFDWQKWSTSTINSKDKTINLWEAWAEDVQTATQGKAVNK